MIIKGWPKQRGECPDNLKCYSNCHDELSILDGLILKGMCIVIPEQCKDEILDQLHEGHFGTDHTKICVRDSVYWPQINKDIEQLVKLVKHAKKTHAGTIKILQFQEKYL